MCISQPIMVLRPPLCLGASLLPGAGEDAELLWHSQAQGWRTTRAGWWLDGQLANLIILNLKSEIGT